MIIKVKFVKAFICAVVLFTSHEQLSAQITITYLADSVTNFPNPERGFNTTFNPDFPPAGITVTDWEKSTDSWTKELDESSLISNRINNGITLHAMRYHLAMFRDKPISEEFLSRLDNDFATARKAGVKLIVRFAYSWIGCRPDAPADRVIGHLSQLKPILKRNQDVLAWMDDGFIGCWGEWHDSSNGLLGGIWGIDITAESRLILDSLFKTVPQSRMVSMRYPTQKYQYFYPKQTYIWDQYSSIPTIEQAYRGTDISRAGNHCDAFRSNEYSGAYCWPGDTILVPNLKSAVGAENLYVVQSGEMDKGFDHTSSRLDCISCVNELKEMHWTALNLDEGGGVVYTGPGSTFHEWIEGGCLKEIEMQLGYRLQITSATLPEKVKAGTTFNMIISIENVGYAPPINPRKLELVLRNTITFSEIHLELDSDPRGWKPGQTEVLNFKINIPSDLNPGQYHMFLSLPDPEPALYGRPEYSIRFANHNVWEEESGFNSLLHLMQISN